VYPITPNVVIVVILVEEEEEEEELEPLVRKVPLAPLELKGPLAPLAQQVIDTALKRQEVSRDVL
jgi:hypothetical protein